MSVNLKRSVLRKLIGANQVVLAIKRTKIRPGQRRPIVKLKLGVPDLDKLGPYDVVVMIYVSQLCDTDVDMGTHDHHGKPTIGFPGMILFGHEGCGIVLAVGSKVTSVKPGDWVSIKVRSGGYGANCINCRAGQPERCLHWNGKRTGTTRRERRFDIREHGIFLEEGTMRQFLHLTEQDVIKAPRGIPANLVACAEPGGVLLAAMLRGFKAWWGDNDWMERTEEGPPAVGVIGAGGLSTLATPVFTDMPWYIYDAMADGALPLNYFSRPADELERAEAGLPPKQLTTPEVYYFARRAKAKAGFKAEVPGRLDAKYVGFEDVNLPFVTVDTGLRDDQGQPIMRDVYNTSPLCDLPAKGKFDWVVELCGNPQQALSLAIPVRTKKQMKTAKYGGMAASGTRICWTSITGGEEAFPDFPASEVLWGATMNNVEIQGVVNYPRLASVLYYYALRRARQRVPGWGDDLQEKLVTPDELLGTDAMYNLKRSVNGKAGAIMNPIELIEEVCDALGVPFSTNE